MILLSFKTKTFGFSVLSNFPLILILKYSLSILFKIKFFESLHFIISWENVKIGIIKAVLL